MDTLSRYRYRPSGGSALAEIHFAHRGLASGYGAPKDVSTRNARMAHCTLSLAKAWHPPRGFFFWPGLACPERRGDGDIRGNDAGEVRDAASDGDGPGLDLRGRPVGAVHRRGGEVPPLEAVGTLEGHPDCVGRRPRQRGPVRRPPRPQVGVIGQFLGPPPTCRPSGPLAIQANLHRDLGPGQMIPNWLLPQKGDWQAITADPTSLSRLAGGTRAGLALGKHETLRPSSAILPSFARRPTT